MIIRRIWRFGFLGLAVSASGAMATEPEVVGASWKPRKLAPAVQPAPAPQSACPPGVTPMPTQPPAPVVPLTPGEPGTPAQPSEPGQPSQLPPMFGQTPPGAQTPPGVADALASSGQSLAQATQGGGAAERTALPMVFGDLPGFGGSIAGPIPAFVSPTGQLAGPPIIVIAPNGQRIQIGGPVVTQLGPPVPQDELIRDRAPGVTAVVNAQGQPGVVSAVPTPGSVFAPLYPLPGTVFDPALAELVARIPVFVRGAFKITENDTPRPTSRAYFTYNFYDQVFNSTSPAFSPRMMVHQEIFGLEYAFDDAQYSLGIRMPYTQVVSTGFFNNTNIGDLTMISKAVLLEDRDTGDLLSGGLALTVPSGQTPFGSTLDGLNPRGTLVQPWAGHILVWDRFFTQGFNSLVVPTSGGQSTFFVNDLAAGYFVYRDPNSFISGIVPTVETHLNIPFTYRGAFENPIGFVDQLTVLGGITAIIRNSGTLGFAVGSPITGPRPFSLQATLQMNLMY